MPRNSTLPTENISQVILGLLKINSGEELDYQTYFNIIRKKLASHRMVGSQIPIEEDELLREELKRVGKLKNKGRFNVKQKTTKVSTQPKSTPTKAKTGAIIKAPFTGITKDSIKPAVEPVSVKDDTDKTLKNDKETNILESINKTLESILNSIIDIGKQDVKEREKNRRNDEEKRRKEKESSLESKTFDGLKKVISTITKPFQSIWDKIVNFIFYTLLGKAVIKLIDWFADPENREKVQSIIRFVTDWWPALLGSYILFGTKFGGLIRFIGGWAVKLAFQLGKVVIPKLLTLIAKNPFTALAVAGGIGAYAATQQNKQRRDEAAKTDPSIVKPEETAKTGKGPGPLQLSEEQIGQQGLGLAFSGGGEVRWPGFSGGGFNFKGMMGSASTGAMFGPLGMLLGGTLGSGKPQEMFNGFVKGPGGPKDDKVPAMLSDGEFVMSAGAVQKYGVDTLESMNAAGGGDNKPKIMGGTTYAAGGGPIGDIPLDTTYGRNPHPDSLRRVARTFSDPKGLQWGTEDELLQIFKKLNGVPDFRKILGEDNFTSIRQGRYETDARLDAMRKSLKDKLHEVINPQSFTQSSRAAAGLDDLAKKFDMDAKTAPRYAENLPRLGRPKPKVTRIDPSRMPPSAGQSSANAMIKAEKSAQNIRSPKPKVARIDPSRMLPSAGQSSANAMRAAAKATQNVRAPIPKSSAIVPYTGGGLARTGVTGGLSVPQIRTNMNVPGGFGGSTLVGGLKSAGVEILASYLLQQGVDKFTAMTLAKQIDDGKKLTGDKKKNYIERLRNVVDKEERWQRGFGGIFDSIINMGGESSSQKRSKHAKAILEGMGSSVYQGGGIKGGYGLKEQSFEDAPKTQIMTDDNGKPFIGYKAIRDGKTVYTRGPQQGTGTTNPFEALGRMVNPGAYKNNDAKLERQKHKESMVNALESFQKQGMAPDAQARMMKQMGGNLKDVQNDLNYRKNRPNLIKQGKLKPDGTPYTAREKMRMGLSGSEKKEITKDSFEVNPYNPFTLGIPGGFFGGPKMKARTDYAASKGKYYSSSDQKTYGNYNDALAAKNSRLTSLASQQRLDKLSRKGGTGGSSGIRYDTEMEAFQKEQNKRGGIFGGIGRGFTRMFGTGEQIEKINAQDKASQVRVKQAGAASIGRYYSSSDGKYYKDYKSAKLARDQRLKTGVKPLPKPKPKPQVAGGGMGGRRGGANRSRPGTKPPSLSPNHHSGNRTSASSYGIMR